MDKNNYFKFELTLLFKAKKLRQTMMFCAYYIFISYLIIQGDIIHSDMCRIIYFPLLIATPGGACIQYISRIHAQYISRQGNNSLSLRTIINKKYYLYCLLSLIVTALLLPMLARGVSLFDLVTYYFTGIGPVLFLSFQMSRWDKKRMNLNESFLKDSGINNAKQVLIGLAYYTLFILLVLAASFFLESDELHLCVLLFSLAFVITHRLWLPQLADYYMKNKYHLIDDTNINQKTNI
jgi:hypothetical protein